MVRQRSYITAPGSTQNFFGLPTYSQAGLRHEGLREWVREGGEERVRNL